MAKSATEIAAETFFAEREVLSAVAGGQPKRKQESIITVPVELAQRLEAVLLSTEAHFRETFRHPQLKSEHGHMRDIARQILASRNALTTAIRRATEADPHIRWTAATLHEHRDQLKALDGNLKTHAGRTKVARDRGHIEALREHVTRVWADLMQIPAPETASE